MDTILNIHQISHSYHTLKGETPALCDISFSVNQGEFLAIVGPSGCGKSTLLSLISGLLKPEQGEILLHEKPVEEQKDKIGYMLQRDELLEWRNIYRNVLIGPEISGLSLLRSAKEPTNSWTPTVLVNLRIPAV